MRAFHGWRMVGAVCVFALVAPACLLDAPADVEAVTTATPVPTPSPMSVYSSSEIGQEFGDAVYRVEAEGCGYPHSGSAFVVAPSLLMTNWHVVSIDHEVDVVSRTGQRYRATVVSADADEDIAILRTSERLSPVLDFAPATEVLEGDDITVLGYPAPSADFSVSPGVVRSIDGDGRITSTAPIDAGNSGGPGLDEHGRVSGVAFAVQAGQFQVTGLLISTEVAMAELERARSGVDESDVMTCAEFDAYIEDLIGEIRPYLRDLPPPP